MPNSHFVESLVEKLQQSASVKAIYGEPIEANGKTIIPVAKVSYGFGGGSGTSAETNEEGSGEGGGGGVKVQPLGVVEILPESTRFVSVTGPRWLIGAFLTGFLFGYWWRR